MKRVLLASASYFALISVAIAADAPVRPVKVLPPVPTFDWTGFYVGINGGAARHEAGIEWNLPGTGSDAVDFTKSKATYGAQLGANWQAQSIVYGIEADLNRVNSQGSANTTNLGLATFIAKLSWLATVRGRVGVLVAPPTLAYLTGGLALGHVEGNWFNSLFEDKTRKGWVLGAGIEHMFAPKWSAKAEVLYADLGNPRTSGAGYVGRFSHTTWLGRVGLNLKW
jgi:outer membrane immunogenic protein